MGQGRLDLKQRFRGSGGKFEQLQEVRACQVKVLMTPRGFVECGDMLSLDAIRRLAPASATLSNGWRMTLKRDWRYSIREGARCVRGRCARFLLAGSLSSRCSSMFLMRDINGRILMIDRPLTRT